MNNESETLLVTAYDVLQDIIMLILNRSWYVVEPEDGPGVLYNVAHNGVSLDTKWQTSSYSTASLLKVSRMVNEALYSVCPAQPMTLETVSVLKTLRDKLRSVPVSTASRSITPLGCNALGMTSLPSFSYCRRTLTSIGSLRWTTMLLIRIMDSSRVYLRCS